MSAFIVTAGHIDYLVSAAISANIPYGSVTWARERVTLANADTVGAGLWRANVTSVAHRYPRDTPDELPGPVPYTDPDTYTFRQYRSVAPVQVLKALACFEYQACEHPGWPASEARAFCDRLRRAVISRLPGYDDAAWEIDDRGGAERVIGPTVDPDACGARVTRLRLVHIQREEGEHDH